MAEHTLAWSNYRVTHDLPGFPETISGADPWGDSSDGTYTEQWVNDTSSGVEAGSIGADYEAFGGAGITVVQCRLVLRASMTNTGGLSNTLASFHLYAPGASLSGSPNWYFRRPSGSASVIDIPAADGTVYEKVFYGIRRQSDGAGLGPADLTSAFALGGTMQTSRNRNAAADPNGTGQLITYQAKIILTYVNDAEGPVAPSGGGWNLGL